MGKKKTIKDNNVDEPEPKPTLILRGATVTRFQALGFETFPTLIPPLTFETLIAKLMSSAPTDRNIFVSMNVYNLHDINPTLKFVKNSPTSIIIFCIRLLRWDKFHPIGAIQTFDDTDQSLTIAQCLEAFIMDLAILGIHVIATISPPNTVFKAVLKHLVSPKDTSKAITYSVGPFKEIIHIYDMKVLLAQFEHLFEQHKECRYIFRNKEECGTWMEIYLVHTAINTQYGTATSFPESYKSDVSIFSPEFQMHFNKCKDVGIVSQNNDSTEKLLILIHSFTSLLDTFDLEVDDLYQISHNWYQLKQAVSSLTFHTLNHPKFHRAFSEDLNFEIEAARIASIMDFLNYQNNNSEHTEENNKSVKNETKTPNKPVIIRNSPKNSLKKTDNNNVDIESCNILNNNNSEINIPNHLVKDVNKENSPLAKDDKQNIINNYLKDRPKSVRANLLLDYLVSNGYKNNSKTDSDNIVKIKNTNAYTNGVKVNNCDIENKQNETEPNYVKNSPFKQINFEVKDIDEFMCNQLLQVNPNSVPKPLKKVLNQPKSNNLTKINNSDTTSKTNNNNVEVVYCDKMNKIPDDPCDDKEKQATEPVAHFERKIVSKDWLSTIYGIEKLSEKLEERKVKRISPFILTSEHTDYYVCLIKRAKNLLKDSGYNGRIYTFLDYDCAFRTLEGEVGLYLIRK